MVTSPFITVTSLQKQNMDDKKTTRHVGVMSLDYKSCLSFILSVISRVDVLSVDYLS